MQVLVNRRGRLRVLQAASRGRRGYAGIALEDKITGRLRMTFFVLKKIKKISKKSIDTPLFIGIYLCHKKTGGQQNERGHGREYMHLVNTERRANNERGMGQNHRNDAVLG